MFLPDFLKSAPVFETCDLPPYIEVRHSKRARRLALRLDIKKRVFHLIIPKGVSIRRARIFALQNDTWMKNRLKELPKLVHFKNGDSISLWGHQHDITINYDRDHNRTDIWIEGGCLIVHTNKKDPHSRIVRFLKNFAKERLEELSIEKARLIRKKIQSVTVRDTKTRWGSCSYDGKLSYSWRLIFAPYESIDYVVAHEVAHLKHLDHSDKFWGLCEKLSDDYDTGKNWMRTNADELMRYQ